jgi:hypothetical protein
VRPLKYQDWIIKVPPAITDDPLWTREVYRLALFLGDLAWYDACALVRNPITVKLTGQLYDALTVRGQKIPKKGVQEARVEYLTDTSQTNLFEAPMPEHEENATRYTQHEFK